MDVNRIRAIVLEAETPDGQVYKDAYRLEGVSLSALVACIVNGAVAACHDAVFRKQERETELRATLATGNREAWRKLSETLSQAGAFAHCRVRVFAEWRTATEIFQEDLLLEFPDGLAALACEAISMDLAKDVFASARTPAALRFLRALPDERNLNEALPKIVAASGITFEEAQAIEARRIEEERARAAVALVTMSPEEVAEADAEAKRFREAETAAEIQAAENEARAKRKKVTK